MLSGSCIRNDPSGNKRFNPTWTSRGFSAYYVGPENRM